MQPGEVLGGRFEIERRVGSGGMGEVYRARDRASGEAVAIKVPTGSQGTGESRLAREAEVLAELSHPGVVRYVAHGTTPSGAPYLAMEWLEGEDLASRLLRGPLSLGETAGLGVRVAAALAAAHARGIVHRDLKPGNLLLVDKDITRVKVLDFGIAHRASAPAMTKPGAVMGTPGYMAPEQARSGQDIDARADVFALGCVLFECLTGTPVFQGAHFMALLAKVLFEDVPRVSERRAGIPEVFESLIAQMTTKDPAGRPRDASAVVAELEAMGSTTLPPSEPVPSSLSGRRASLTRSERRVLSVVLLGAQRPLDAQSAPVPGVVEIRIVEEELYKAAEAHGGALTLLADGSAIVTIGAPASVATDQAAQAARCALALRALRPDLPMALATGRAEMTRKQLVGDAIDRAAQMLSKITPLARNAQAPMGDGPLDGARRRPVVIDEVTAALLDARFEVIEGEAGLWLHGEQELVEGTRTLLGKATACVGRDWEIGTLDAFLSEAMEESMARAVLVTAPAGMGKSRLGYEVVRRVRQRGEPIAVWIGRCDSLRAGSPFFLLGQVLRGVLGIQDGDPLEARQARLLARVGERLPEGEARRVAELLGELVGTPFSDEGSALLRAARQDAQLMGEQLRGAWLDFLRAELEAQPVLLMLEDLHWGDLPSVRFIDAALREQQESPWMVLAFARPSVHGLFPKLWAERGLQEIRLKELSARAAARLVRQVLGEGVSAETVERVVAQADGHAFYLEELIRAVAEGKGEALPDTVLSMVHARLSSLEGEARRVLRAASVFGEVCWQGGVAALLGGAMQAARAGEWLSILVEREMLVRRAESRFPGEVEFMFRHALLREGAYATLTDEDRVLGHRLVGRWLSRSGETDPTVLAEHFDRGKEPARACGYYLRAAEQALRGSDTDMAMAHARRSLKMLAPEELQISLLGLLCEAHGWRSEWTLASIYGEQVRMRAARGSTPWITATFIQFMSALYQGELEETLEALRVLSEVEPAPEAVGMLVLALVAGVFFFDSGAQFGAAEATLARCVAISAPVAGRDPIPQGWVDASHGLRDAVAREDPWSGLAKSEAARAVFRTVGHTRGSQLAQVFAGMNAWFLGALPAAEEALRGTSIPDEEFSHLASYRPFLLACVLADRGALPEAEAIATQLAEVGHARGAPADEGRGRWALAEVLRRKGDLPAAEREARVALSLLAMMPLERLGVTAALAAILLAEGRVPEALAAAEEAVAHAEAMKACGFFRGSAVRLVHAEALAAAGEQKRARAAITAARERLLRIADKIGEPAYRRSFLGDVPENARTLALAEAWQGEGG